MDATNMAIDIDIFIKAFALRSHATPFSTLEKLFIALLVLFNKSPTPSKIFAKLPKASANFFRISSIPTIDPPANSFPHSIFPLSSVMKSQKLLKTFTITSLIFFRTPVTGPAIDLIPFISPLKKSTAISNAFQDGE